MSKSANEFLSRIPAAAGSYALVLKLSESASIEVGRLGKTAFPAGYYLYVGSAFGPGGLRARLGRHWAGTGRRHWHVDYLRAAATPVAAWLQVQDESREHAWAGAMDRGRGLTAVQGFGSTDCSCPSHLFHGRALPSLDAFSRRLGGLEANDGPLISVQGLPAG